MESTAALALLKYLPLTTQVIPQVTSHTILLLTQSVFCPFTCIDTLAGSRPSAMYKPMTHSSGFRAEVLCMAQVIETLSTSAHIEPWAAQAAV